MTGHSLRTRQKRHDELADRIRTCTNCDGMNIEGETQAAPGWGSLESPVVIVGQSLCEPCMEKQEPFVGGSGELLDISFDRAQIAQKQLYITNVVHCHPRDNEKSRPEWKKNCTPYLHEELRIVQPKLIIGLGQDAEVALRAFYPHAGVLSWPFRTPRISASEESPRVHFVKHPSWINRQHSDALERQYVASLERALRWGFLIRPTCGGMIGPESSETEGISRWRG
jgi:uracil-DNA glycosylase